MEKKVGSVSCENGALQGKKVWKAFPVKMEHFGGGGGGGGGRCGEYFL